MLEQYSSLPSTARFVMGQQDRMRQQALARQAQMGAQQAWGGGPLGGFLEGMQLGAAQPHIDAMTGEPVGMQKARPLFSERELHKFHRINEKATITKRDFKDRRFQEPLDELRIEVAQWLNN